MKNVKRIILITVLLLLLSVQSYSQSNLSLPLSEAEVYSLLDNLYARGVIGKISMTKPYSEKKTVKMLEKALENQEMLLPGERQIIKTLIEKIDKEMKIINFSVKGETENRTDLESIYSHNLASIGIEGSLSEYLSYNLNYGMTFDLVDSSPFVPFSFTKQWDGFHFSADDGDYSFDETEGFSRASLSLPELSFESKESIFRISFSRYRRDWGIGEHDLFLSDSARPMEGVELKGELSDTLFFTSFTGNSSDPSDKMRDQKMFSLHMVEYAPFEWLYLSFAESAVWGKRLEFTYLNPLSVYYVSQNQIGDLDNIAVGGSMGIRVNPSLFLYSSLFIDEIEVQKMGEFFRNPKNQYAWYAGLKSPLKILPFGMITFQYTKIEPYCYTHYVQDYPYTDTDIDISYTNDGEGIGYPLPPNSDEFMLKISLNPFYSFGCFLKYSLIRHGDNPEAGAGNYLIEGDIDDFLDYSQLDNYPDKDFLDDGIYEILNIITLNLRKSISDITLWGEYSLMFADNFKNTEGQSEVKNYLSAGIIYSKSF